MNFLKRKSKYDWIAISCYIFMVFVIVGEGYWNHARAGNLQWSIQMHFPITGHHDSPYRHGHVHPHRHSGSLGTGGPTITYTDIHNHVHRPYLYGWHIHQGVKYPVEYVYRNYRGEICKEFQMDIQFMFGLPERAWATVCQDRAGFWRLQQ